MIEVKNAKDLGYQYNGGPALTLSHTLSSAQLTEIIKLAAAARGDDFVLDAIGRKPAESGREYMCFVDGGSAPQAVHAYRSHAMAEAKRLAEKTGRSVTMLARVARVEVTNTTRVTVLDDGKE